MTLLLFTYALSRVKRNKQNQVFFSVFNYMNLTSRDSGKESQNQPVTKIYLVGFNHDAELLYRKRSQETNPLWSIVKESRNLIGRENIGPKKQELHC